MFAASTDADPTDAALQEATPAAHWQRPYAGGFDFTGLEAPARHALPGAKTLRTLERCHEVRQRRTLWATETITAVLERGVICAATTQQQESFARLYLRTDHGTDHSPERLTDLAQALCATVLLLPETLSVHEIARRLDEEQDSGAVSAPFKARPIRLAADSPAAQSYRHIARNCLQQLLRNHEGACVSADNPEYVHQMRVAVRRLRAATQIFKGALPEGFSARLLPNLRALMASLGRTRDLDVLIHDIVAPVHQALPDEPRLVALMARLQERLLAARHAVGAVLTHPDFAREQWRVHALVEALTEPLPRQPLPPISTPMPTPTAGGAPSAELPIHTYADQRLRKRLKAAKRCAKAARADDPESLHALRIAIKRLRYGLEFFCSLLPGKTARKVLRRLATLQEELGQFNDLASAGALLMDCAGDDQELREAVSLIAGWHGTRYTALLQDIPRHLKDVADLRLPVCRAPSHSD